jgi:hypothetical protein
VAEDLLDVGGDGDQRLYHISYIRSWPEEEERDPSLT